MSIPIFANDLPYEAGGADDPLRALGDTLAFTARDCGQERDVAWIYGIVLGWDNEDDPDDDGGDAMSAVAGKHGWSNEQVARLRRLRTAFRAQEATR